MACAPRRVVKRCSGALGRALQHQLPGIDDLVLQQQHTGGAVVVGVDLAQVLRAVIPGSVAAVYRHDRLADDREPAAQRAEGRALEGPFQAGAAGPGGLDPVRVHELRRRRPQHLECSGEQPALRAMRDLGPADRLQRLPVGAPQRAARSPYRRFEQKRMRHRCIMAPTAGFGVRCHQATAEGTLMWRERIWSGNSLRNFHYLIACAETGEALAVDPLEWRLCLEAARKRGWGITQILNTHEHTDPTRGNAGLKTATHP